MAGQQLIDGQRVRGQAVVCQLESGAGRCPPGRDEELVALTGRDLERVGQPADQIAPRA
jgi:hypothetical protein